MFKTPATKFVSCFEMDTVPWIGATDMYLSIPNVTNVLTLEVLLTQF
jgi:hypothetical protein